MSERVQEGEPRELNIQECEANYTPPSIVEITYEWNQNSASLIYRNGVDMDNVIFYLSFIEIRHTWGVQ